MPRGPSHFCPQLPEGYNETPSDGTEQMVDFHGRAMDHQLQQLYYGFALAMALNRTLLLPQVSVCGVGVAGGRWSRGRRHTVQLLLGGPGLWLLTCNGGCIRDWIPWEGGGAGESPEGQAGWWWVGRRLGGRGVSAGRRRRPTLTPEKVL